MLHEADPLFGRVQPIVSLADVADRKVILGERGPVKARAPAQIKLPQIGALPKDSVEQSEVLTLLRVNKDHRH